MIKQIEKWTIPYERISPNVFTTLDIKTNKLLEYSNTLIADTTYYPVAENYLPCNKQFPYQRCVNLFFVEYCVTETGDDLEKYGFELKGYDNRGKLWNKQIF